MNPLVLAAYIESERPAIEQYFTFRVIEIKLQMEFWPNLFITAGTNEEPSIDIRLCIDFDTGNGHGMTWQVYVGDAFYDPVHYPLCGGGKVTLKTKAEALLEKILEQILKKAGSAK